MARAPSFIMRACRLGPPVEALLATKVINIVATLEAECHGRRTLSVTEVALNCSLHRVGRELFAVADIALGNLTYPPDSP